MLRAEFVKKGRIDEPSDQLYGRVYDPKKVTDKFIHLANRLGYPGITFHKLRHSYAPLLLERGEDTRTIQENLGQVTNRITEIYAHVIEKMKRRAV